MKYLVIGIAVFISGCNSIHDYELKVMEAHCADHGGIGSVHVNVFSTDKGVTCANGQRTRFDQIT